MVGLIHEWIHYFGNGLFSNSWWTISLFFQNLAPSIHQKNGLQMEIPMREVCAQCIKFFARLHNKEISLYVEAILTCLFVYPSSLSLALILLWYLKVLTVWFSGPSLSVPCFWAEFFSSTTQVLLLSERGIYNQSMPTNICVHVELYCPLNFLLQIMLLCISVELAINHYCWYYYYWSGKLCEIYVKIID